MNTYIYHPLDMLYSSQYLKELSNVKSIQTSFLGGNPLVIYSYKHIKLLMKYYCSNLDQSILNDLFNIAKKNSIYSMWLYINDDSKLVENYLIKEKYNYSKSYLATYNINLSKNLDEIFNNIKSKRRNQIKKAIKEKIIIKTEFNKVVFDQWWNIYLKTVERGSFLKQNKEMVLHLLESGNCKLFSAWFNGKLIAGSVIVINNYPMWWLGASLREYFKYNGSSLLQWEIIKWAKSQSYSIYDMGGASLDENHGPTKFKKSFTGEYFISPIYKIILSKKYYIINFIYDTYNKYKKSKIYSFFRKVTK